MGERIEDGGATFREMLAALEAAEPIIAFSLSYYGSDEAVSVHKQVRTAIANARSPSEPLNARTQGVEVSHG